MTAEHSKESTGESDYGFRGKRWAHSLPTFGQGMLENKRRSKIEIT